MLGLFEASRFEEERLTLQPGDTIVTFSDGVTEALNVADEEFGDERLVECVKMQADQPPRRMLQALLAAVHRFCGGATPNDVLTMVIVRYEG